MNYQMIKCAQKTITVTHIIIKHSIYYFNSELQRYIVQILESVFKLKVIVSLEIYEHWQVVASMKNILFQQYYLSNK